jgi:hypothetical protein
MIQSRSSASFPSARPILLTALMTLAALGAACKSASSNPTPAAAPQQAGRVDLSNDLTAKAAVISVDKASRLVTLRKEDGSTLTVQAGPAVRNFDQIAPGDQLNVRYHETLSASMRPSSETTAPAKGAVVAGRAKVGDTPAGGVGMAATAKVKIASVDKENSIVVFALDSGELRTVKAARPEGREFISKLKVGDIVQIDYTVSLAMALDKQ